MKIVIYNEKGNEITDILDVILIAKTVDLDGKIKELEIRKEEVSCQETK